MNDNHIPELLKGQLNWGVWGVVGEPPKAPFQPNYLLRFTAVPAKSGVHETWGTFAAAVDCVNKGLAKGIGYEFDGRPSPAGRGIYGIDLDHVISDGGAVTPEARAVVEGLNSYTEVSPSGHGLHIFVTADRADITRHRRQGGFVEIYSNARYFTVTGNVYGGFDSLADNPVELQQLHDRYLLPEPSKSVVPAYPVDSPQSADESLQRGLLKDPVLRSCWNGERRGGDESASDQALMNKLAYWCNANPSAMIAAFMSSPYYAQKDEAHQRKCGRSDYLPNTAKAACSTLRSTAQQDTEKYRKKVQNDRER
jgi:putative DNA primase/helicase